MDICRNTASFANQYEFNAVKLNITHDELARFKQRTFNDEAIIYEGKCYLPNERVEIIELVLDLNKGNNIIIRPKTEKEKKQYIPSPQLIQHLKLKQKK
jgi:hypothetical protein